MGFHYTVHEFQPVYKFNDKHLEDLQIGNEILREHLDREAAKKQRMTTSVSDKEVRESIRQKVRYNLFEDQSSPLLQFIVDRIRRYNFSSKKTDWTRNSRIREMLNVLNEKLRKGRRKEADKPEALQLIMGHHPVTKQLKMNTFNMGSHLKCSK